MNAGARLVAAALALALVAIRGVPPAAAHSVLDFDDWMQRIDEGNQDLQRRIVARDRVKALEIAREMETLYRLMEEFFENRGTGEPAVRMSREGRELAAGAVKFLEARNFRAARDNALRIGRGCRTCHIDYKPL